MEDKRILKVLKKYGLSEKEAVVYIQALKLEETSPYELSKLTGIPRTTVYDVITDLSLKGLLELEQSDGFTKQQTKIKAKNPSTLRKILRQKHQDLYELDVDLVEILPALKSTFYKDEANADFQFYPGIEGAKKVYFTERHLDVDLPRYVFTHLMPMDSFGMEAINKDIEYETEQRRKKKIPVKEIIPMNRWTGHVLTYQCERDPDYLVIREYRFIDNPIFNQYQRLVIFGTRVMAICAEEDEIWGLVINSKAFSKSMISIFQLLWPQATPVTVELVRSWGRNQFRRYEKRREKENSVLA